MSEHLESSSLPVDAASAEAAGAIDPDGVSALFDIDDDETDGVDLSTRSFPGHRVEAVLVSHDGARWVERAVAAVLEQDRPVQSLRIADTGSTDGTVDLLTALEARPGGPELLRLPRDTGFGAAVARVLSARPATAPDPAPAPGPDEEPVAAEDVTDWLWLLHDDSAPEPGALRHLLAAVDASPSVALAGPKIVGWADPRHLLEVGVTIARSGARDTGLERHEQDQGQHDAVRSVLAVSTAGMLVRRDVWDALGGLDPLLPVFRDDIDLGWRVNAAGHRVLVVPDAVVHHAEGATHRRRRIAAGPDQPHRLDRRHALRVLLAHQPGWLLPWVLVRLTVGSLLRALGFLLGKDPGFALAEVRAIGDVLAHPGLVRRMRRERRATRRVPYRDLRGLLSPPGTQLRHGVEILGGAIGSGSRRPSRIAAPAEPGGDGYDDDADLLSGADSALSRWLRRPGVVLVLAMLALTLVAERALVGSGHLLGGALLPAPDGASSLWSTYTAGWSQIGVGASTPAAVYPALMALAAVPLLGKVTLLVDLLLLLSVPMAAATAYLAMRGVVRSLVLRLWAAAVYAIAPAATGAVAAGRLGTALVLVLLPLFARPALRLAGVVGPEPTWRTAWGTGLFLALLVAFVPGLWVLAVVLAIVAALTTAPGRAARLRLLAALAVPPLVLVPWTWELVRHPSYLLVEAGVPSAAVAVADPHPALALLLAPGGPGTPPAWIGLGIVLAAVAAVLRGVRPRFTVVAVAVALVAVAVALVVAQADVRTPQLERAVPAWNGAFLVVAGAAALLAATFAADGARKVLVGRSFGWRQPVTLLIALLCVAGPAIAAVGWVVRGADEPVRRAPATALPAFVVADTRTPARPRTLALREDGPGSVSYSIVRGDGARLGDAEAAPASSATPALPGVVSALAAGGGDVSGGSLIPYGVRYVVVERGGQDDRRSALARTLDSTPELRRLSSGEGEAVWRVVGTTARARLIPTEGAPVPLPAGEVDVSAALPRGWAGGVLALADARSDGWRASVDGRSLAPTTVDGWAQGFTVPAGPGRIEVTHDHPGRARWIVVQLVVIGVVVVLALPARRREGEGEDA